MFSWSFNLFRIRGIQLAVHFTFLLLLGWAAYEGYEDTGIPGMLWSAATLIAFFTCVVLHELGHSFTGMRYGVHVHRILLMPIGGMAQFDAIHRKPSQELLMTLAGPAVNFAIAGILWPIVNMGRWDPSGTPASFADIGRYLAAANIVMGLFNLIPVFPMDGGRILRALLATRLDYLRATKIASLIGKVLAILAIAWSIYVGHYLLAALFTFILGAGDAEYRAVKRDEAARTHWEEMLKHISHAPAAADEPPLLEPKKPDWELMP